MMILTIRSDNPVAEIGLYDNEIKLAYESWEAHRHLAETLHIKLKELLTANKKGWLDIEGVVVYAGPGSFTGLRIGIATANALAYANDVPIVASSDEKWQEVGIKMLKNGQGKKSVVPEYGMPAHTTTPKK